MKEKTELSNGMSVKTRREKNKKTPLVLVTSLPRPFIEGHHDVANKKVKFAISEVHVFMLFKAESS